jgi:hypothetical protein
MGEGKRRKAAMSSGKPVLISKRWRFMGLLRKIGRYNKQEIKRFADNRF